MSSGEDGRLCRKDTSYVPDLAGASAPFSFEDDEPYVRTRKGTAFVQDAGLTDESILDVEQLLGPEDYQAPLEDRESCSGSATNTEQPSEALGVPTEPTVPNEVQAPAGEVVLDVGASPTSPPMVDVPLSPTPPAQEEPAQEQPEPNDPAVSPKGPSEDDAASVPTTEQDDEADELPPPLTVPGESPESSLCGYWKPPDAQGQWRRIQEKTAEAYDVFGPSGGQVGRLHLDDNSRFTLTSLRDGSITHGAVQGDVIRWGESDGSTAWTRLPANFKPGKPPPPSTPPPKVASGKISSYIEQETNRLGLHLDLASNGTPDARSNNGMTPPEPPSRRKKKKKRKKKEKGRKVVTATGPRSPARPGSSPSPTNDSYGIGTRVQMKVPSPILDQWIDGLIRKHDADGRYRVKILPGKLANAKGIEHRILRVPTSLLRPYNKPTCPKTLLPLGPRKVLKPRAQPKFERPPPPPRLDSMSQGAARRQSTSNTRKVCITLQHPEWEAVETFKRDLMLRRINAVSDIACMRFVLGRKLNVKRAVNTFFNYVQLLRKWEATATSDDMVRQELEKGLVHIGGLDATGKRIIAIQAHKITPVREKQGLFLKSIVMALDAAVSDLQTMRDGITVMFDMTGFQWSNFSTEMFKMYLETLQNCYPVRVKSIILVDSPWWIKGMLKMVKPFMKKKHKERVLLLKSDSDDFKQCCPHRELPGCFRLPVGSPRAADEASHVWRMIETMRTTNFIYKLAEG